MLFLVQPIHAATINVTANAVDTVVNGNCSLIEAIQAAETDAAVDACTAGSGADIINVPAGTYTLTVVDNILSGENGLPQVGTTITVVGAGASTTIITRSGATRFRFFRVLNTGNLTLNGVTLSNGNANATGNDGGAVRNFGTLAILNSTLSGNDSSAGGSAIFTQGASSSVTITNSTLSGNIGSPAFGTFTGGPTTITNSTLSGNPAGGIENQNALTVTYSTIAGNGGTGIDQNAGAGTTSINNSIVANNTTNCAGVIGDGGSNLQFPGATCGAGITTADPLLGALGSNGGTTQTMALSMGSPAIDAANNAICPATDQRGVSRPQVIVKLPPLPPTCDIGAFELSPTNTPVPTLQEWVVGVLALMLMLIGMRRMRRG